MNFVFSSFVVKQPTLDYHNWVQYLDLTPDGINPLTTTFLWVCSYWGAWLFLRGLVWSFKNIFYLFFTEKQFLLESLFLFVIWNNLAELCYRVICPAISSGTRMTVNLMRNAFGLAILDVFSCDQCSCYKSSYKDIFLDLNYYSSDFCWILAWC